MIEGVELSNSLGSWGQIVTWVIILGTWGIGLYIANKRYLDSNRKDTLDSICRLIDRIVDNANEYYLLNGSDSKTGVIGKTIVSDFHRLLKIIDELGDEKLSLSWRVFHRGVTGGAFQSKSREAMDQDDSVFESILSDAGSLKSRCEKFLSKKNN